MVSINTAIFFGNCSLVFYKIVVYFLCWPANQGQIICNGRSGRKTRSNSNRMKGVRVQQLSQKRHHFSQIKYP